MEECKASRLTNTETIRKNLIGDWRLVGHALGWSSSDLQPGSCLHIAEDSLRMRIRDYKRDTSASYSWELVEVPSKGNTYHYLRTHPEAIDYMRLHVFCEEYMYYDATQVDGCMLLYHKVR